MVVGKVGRRKVWVAFTAVLATMSLGLSPLASSQAFAAPVTGFNAGNIISDENFFDSQAMTRNEVQNFLQTKVKRCTIGDSGRKPGSQLGSTRVAAKCLRDFTMTTTSRSSNAYCKSYAGQRNESAARIITKIGQACGISQKVLLIMLEKEQSLVTDSWPTVRQFNVAMGYACPDTGPNNSANCDSAYYGFFNQVYHAALQITRYGADPNTFNWFPVGKVSRIQHHPNTSCGTEPVRIMNKATAALYYYTPYMPNKAALNAGWGTGDRCSSYGNRNFFNFYKSWFGDPHESPKDFIGREL